MNSILKITALILLVALWSSCEVDDPTQPYEDNRFIKDDYGRTIILHGLNTASDAKHGDFLPWISESDVANEIGWGFNSVRYLISWAGVEPNRGEIDYDYIDAIAERVEWYTSRQMYVVLDMHQDVYGELVGGNGAPDWAVETNGHVYVGGYDTWWLNNLDPATIAAYQNFWRYSDYAYLQDHYIAMWMELVDRFKDNPYVIGYDLMNEPHAGDLRQIGNGNFERYYLKQFTDRMIAAIREIDNDNYIFFEGQSLGTNLGLPSRLPRIEDPRSGPRKLIYAPHCYPLFVDLGGGVYNNDGKNNVKTWEVSRMLDLDRHKTPMYVGEFGLSPEIQGFDEYINDFHETADRMQASWAYWSNDQGGWSPTDGQGNETPILNELIRTYPQAISGRLLKFNYDENTKVFNLKFVSDASIGMPTEIFIPNRFYENGWDLVVEGTTNYTEEWNAERQTLLFSTPMDETTISIQVKPS